MTGQILLKCSVAMCLLCHLSQCAVHRVILLILHSYRNIITLSSANQKTCYFIITSPNAKAMQLRCASFWRFFFAKTFGHQLNTEVYSIKFPFNECCISSLLFRSFTSRTKGCKCERAFGPCQRWM